jgi:hypothetical protein
VRKFHRSFFDTVFSHRTKDSSKVLRTEFYSYFFTNLWSHEEITFISGYTCHILNHPVEWRLVSFCVFNPVRKFLSESFIDFVSLFSY